MNTEKSSLLERPVYPVLFMLLLNVVFVGVLAFFFRSTEAKIENRKKQAFQTQILSLFADTLSSAIGKSLSDYADPDSVEVLYTRFVFETELKAPPFKAVDPTYYTIKASPDQVIGYCFNVSGNGLWGTMRGMLAVTTDFSRIINFSIYEQMETPGLGSRVEEEWFKRQFTRKNLIVNQQEQAFLLVPEESETTASEVRQITGATITSQAVLKMLQEAAAELRKSFLQKAE